MAKSSKKVTRDTLLEKYLETKKVIPKTPELLSDALIEMDKLVWLKVNEDLPASKLAFATKSPSGVFKVFVNNKIPEEYQDHFYLHEFGHVLFGHLFGMETQREQFKRKIMESWSKIEPHLELTEEEQKLPTVELVSKFLMPVSSLLLNYATDMEVNSKLFSDDEWEEMRNVTDYVVIKTSYEEGNRDEEFLKSAKDFLKGKGDHISKPIWPVDYGFEKGLSYHAYLDLMIQDIDKFMNFVRQDSQSLEGDGEGEGNSAGQNTSNSNGNGSGSSDSDNSSGEGSSGKETKDELQKALKKLSLKDIEDLRKAANNSDVDTVSNNATAAEAGEGSGDEDDTASDGSSAKGGNGLGFGRGTSKVEALTLSNGGRELTRFLLKETFSRKIENTRVNEMYYYNRRKYGDKDIIGKTTKENVYRPGDVYIIIDVSGSVNEKAINVMLKCTRDVAKKCGAKSRAIWWDTCLQGDMPIRKAKLPSNGYGGTDMAGAIQYVKDKYIRSSNDKIIIVSDFCDTLKKWYDVASTFSNDITGVCWSERSRSNYSSLEHYIESSNYGYDFSVKQFLKRIPTKIVDITRF